MAYRDATGNCAALASVGNSMASSSTCSAVLTATCLPTRVGRAKEECNTVREGKRTSAGARGEGKEEGKELNDMVGGEVKEGV